MFDLRQECPTAFEGGDEFGKRIFQENCYRNNSDDGRRGNRAVGVVVLCPAHA